MKDETRQWIEYARQDYESARILMENHLFNSCLYHVQQTIEKFLKAFVVENELEFRRTHSIQQLMNVLSGVIDVDMDEDDIDLIDSVYMPSRYPVGAALPSFVPDREICERCLGIAESVINSVTRLIMPENSE